MARKFRKGDRVVYESRVWIIEAIKGDSAQIYAPKSSCEIGYEDFWRFSSDTQSGKTPQQLTARKYGAKLVGRRFNKTCSEGAYVSQKMVWPEERKKVKLTGLQ